MKIVSSIDELASEMLEIEHGRELDNIILKSSVGYIYCDSIDEQSLIDIISNSREHLMNYHTIGSAVHTSIKVKTQCRLTSASNKSEMPNTCRQFRLANQMDKPLTARFTWYIMSGEIANDKDLLEQACSILYKN